MSRLIDADKLIEELNYHKYACTNDEVNEILHKQFECNIDVIKKQPTAFDVNDVMERLEELKDKALKRREELIELNSYNNIILKNIEYERGREYAFDDALDIVKAGGIDE